MNTPRQDPSDFTDVRMFHMKFGQPTDMSADGSLNEHPPHHMPHEQFVFRQKFLREELDEFSLGYNKGNLIKATDSLLDLVYVCWGTALFMGAGPNCRAIVNSWPTFERVRSFSVRAGFVPSTAGVPKLLSPHGQELMRRKMLDAMDGFFLAHEADDPWALRMALSHLWDLGWCTYLTGALMQLPWANCWRHVQEANMKKVRAQKDGSDSTRGSGWDVVKPIGWCAPDKAIGLELILNGADIPAGVLAEADKASEPKA